MLLEKARCLLSHAIPDQDVDKVLRRLITMGIAQLEKRKFGMTSKPRAPRMTRLARTIPAAVRRAVFERDGGRCTFVSADDRRCEARDHLEYDHVQEFARGGNSTIDNIRLRCRPHNQYEAERTYGAEFIKNKIEQRRERSAETPAKRAAATTATAQDWTPEEHQAQRDFVACLRNLGFTVDEVNRAAAETASMNDASLEERVRAALKSLAPPAKQQPAPEFDRTRDHEQSAA
jgi:5-methylcytosine-specific restriction endonuclease McrA